MKQGNEQTLQQALKLMLDELRLSARLNETKIKNLWEQRMGKTVATYTSQISVRKNVLYLTIISAPLKQELSFSKEKIKTLLNEELGESFIKEVVIQ